jgi:hypothetical protein
MSRFFLLGLIAATLGACAPTPVIAANNNPIMQTLLTGPRGNDNPIMRALLTGPRRNEDVTIKM